MTTHHIHDTLRHVLIQYDTRQSKKRGYNPYAIAHYCDALQHADKLMEAGRTPREALIGCFSGRLLDSLLKAIGQPVCTKEEIFGASLTREEL